MEHLPQLVAAGDTCLDIGANIGDYGHALSPLVGPSGAVHCFEPVEAPFTVLRLRKRVFGLSNVTCHRLALGQSVGTGHIVVPNGRPGDANYAHIMSGEPPPGHDVELVATTSLDAWAQGQGLTRIDFIKCDVEGYELEVLKGGADSLRAFRPVILCEIEEGWQRYGYSTDDTFFFLSSLDFQGHVYEAGELWPVTGTVPGHINYFFIPGERR